MEKKTGRRSGYTFKYNRELGRHGWLRLTPAYSVKLVKEVIHGIPKDSFVLDPFSGTGTTGLVAAERGFSAHCLDINPFLIWLGNAKCRNYSASELRRLKVGVNAALAQCQGLAKRENWAPNMHNITRWWCGHTLKGLAALRQSLVNQFGEPKNDDASALAWISFCRLIIETSAAAFNHVSMSFHDEAPRFDIGEMEGRLLRILDAIIEGAKQRLPGEASIHFMDSREMASVNAVKYSHVVTSPPYPNRISYIRELRPYLYWTKFLDTAQEAGELDWKAIGGTWGVATSRLQNWKTDDTGRQGLLEQVVSSILETREKNAPLMANYVWKYFHDMRLHLENLPLRLKKGATLCYIVGNSSFYGVPVRTDRLLEEYLRLSGFDNVGSKIIRKRNSKKELFEYCVYATWQESKEMVPAHFGARQADIAQLELLR